MSGALRASIECAASGGHARSWRSRLTRPSVGVGWRSDLDLVCLDAYLVNRHAFLGRGPLPPARWWHAKLLPALLHVSGHAAVCPRLPPLGA